MRSVKLVLYTAIILLISSLAMAQTNETVTESFNYPLGSVLDTLGQAGSGWAGGWYIADSSFNHNSKLLVVSDTGTGTDFESVLNYPVYRPVGGKSVVGVIPVAWSYIRYARYLSHEWTNTKGNVYWLSFVNDLENGSNNCWNVCSLWDSTYEEYGAPHGWGTDTAMINGVANAKVTDNLLCQGTGPHWWVLEMNMNGDSTARIFLWHDINPGGGQPDTSNADARGTYNFWQHGAAGQDSILHKGFNAVHLEFSNSDSGTHAMFAMVRLSTTWAGVSDNNGGSWIDAVNAPSNTVPSHFALSQNYPNPFNPTTQISYSVPKNSFVTLKVYNILGQRVATLYSGVRRPGNYIATFNASGLASGVYLYRLEAGTTSITRKLMLLK